MDQIDIWSLRGALRLANCLQKERSHACCFVISKHGDIVSAPPMSEVCSSHRSRTDAAITQYQQYIGHNDTKAKTEISSNLKAARAILEDEGAKKLESESSAQQYASVLLAKTFQCVLMEYNEVIENLFKTGVFKYRPVPAVLQLLGHQSSTLNLAKSVMDGFENMTMDMSSLLHSFTALRAISKYSKSLNKENERNQEKRTDADQRVVTLFSILVNLLRLNESSLIKTLFFAQLLVCNDDANVQVIMNYLIMHIAEETSMVVTLEELSKNTINSIFARELLHPGEELFKLIQLMLNDFNLKAFQRAVTFQEFIRLSSAYHDKLHGLLLFILEEIESSQFLSTKVKPMKNPMVNEHGIPEAVIYGLGLLASSGKNGRHEKNIRQSLNDVPADDLKKMFVSMIDANIKPEEKQLRIGGSQRKAYNVVVNDRSISKSRNKSRIRKDRSTSKSEMVKEASRNGSDNKSEASYLPELLPVIAEWHVELNEIAFTKKVGTGSAGTTYLAKWRREEVAVKVANATSLGILSWNMELRALQKLHHPNIIRMMGCMYSETPFAMCLILEYCNLGDLGNALCKSTPPNFFHTVVMGLSTGLEYLHSKGVLHRDVKPDNILIHGKMETCDISVKLTDFGLSTTFKVPRYLRNSDDSVHSIASASSLGEGEEEEHTAEAGTYRWMAPEVIRHEPYNFKADVYSFGMVLWQLVTREKPFHNNQQEEAAKLVALGYQRPPFPRGVPKAVMSVIDMAWEEDPDERPTFVELCEIFEGWISKDVLSGREKAWLDQARGHAVYNKKKAADNTNNDGGRTQRRLSGSGFFSRQKSSRQGTADRRISDFF